MGVENLPYSARNCWVHVYNEYSCPLVRMQLQEVRVKSDDDLARARRFFHDPSIARPWSEGLNHASDFELFLSQKFDD